MNFLDESIGSDLNEATTTSVNEYFFLDTPHHVLNECTTADVALVLSDTHVKHL